MLVGLLGQAHAALFDRQAPARALQGGENMHPHLAVGRVVEAQVGQPVAQVVDAVTMLEIHQHASRFRCPRRMRDFRFADGLFDGRDHARGRRRQVDREAHMPAPLRRFSQAPTEHGELALHQRAVGHYHGFPVAGFDRGRAPADVDHAPDRVVDADPVADLDRVVQLDRDAAKDVAERVLHGERQHPGDHGGTGEDRARIHAGRAQARDHPDEISQDGEQVFGDARRGDARERQQGAEQQHAGQADDGNARDQQRRIEERAGAGAHAGGGQHAGRQLCQHGAKEDRERIADRGARLAATAPQHQGAHHGPGQHPGALGMPAEGECVAEVHARSVTACGANEPSRPCRRWRCRRGSDR